MKAVFATALLLVSLSAHARIEQSVTCGRVVSLNGDRVTMESNGKKVVVNKASLPTPPSHLQVPGNACVRGTRLPSSVPAAADHSVFLRPMLYRTPAKFSKSDLQALEFQNLKFHPLRAK